MFDFRLISGIVPLGIGTQGGARMTRISAYAAGAALCLISTGAQAMTGAEFLQIDRYFAYGYLTGVVDVRLGVIHTDDDQLVRIRTCFLAAKLTNETLYDVVVSHLRSHPHELTRPAFGAIYNTLADMCPPGSAK